MLNALLALVPAVVIVPSVWGVAAPFIVDVLAKLGGVA